MRRFLALLVLVVSAAGVQAQSLERIDITEFGIYVARRVETIPAPGSAAGERHTITDERLVKSTTTVPALLGTRFGFRYRLVGRGSAAVRLKKVTHIPHPGVHNPSTGNVMRTSTIELTRSVGDVSVTTYTFDYTWEIVPGSWTIELWDGDRKLAGKVFEVVRQ